MGLGVFSLCYHVHGIITRQELCLGIFLVSLSDSTSTAVYEWTPALAAFIRSSRMQGHRIVPLGHSAGAAAMYVFIFFYHDNRYQETARDALRPRASQVR